jgi:hypothetical protein
VHETLPLNGHGLTSPAQHACYETDVPQAPDKSMNNLFKVATVACRQVRLLAQLHAHF